LFIDRNDTSTFDIRHLNTHNDTNTIR